MMVERVLMKIRQWMNEGILLRDDTVKLVEKREMFQFLAVLLSSHTTGLTLNKICDMLKKFGSVVTSVERVRWISENVVAYALVGRWDEGATQWHSDCDQTPKSSKFEELSFKDTRSVFLIVLHLFATLDDDLFGTRAHDNQFKMISNRKADKEGHSADALADALSRVLLAMRFWRRGEHQVDSVRNMLTGLFDGMVQGALNSCIITADQGYGKDSFLSLLSSFGLVSMFIIPYHIIGAHPFVASSYFNPRRGDEEEEFEERL